MGGASGTYGRGEVHTGFSCGDFRKRAHFKCMGVDGRIIIKWIFQKSDGEPWTGPIWLRIGVGGGRFAMR
jgi:hypothetical protein